MAKVLGLLVALHQHTLIVHSMQLGEELGMEAMEALAVHLMGSRALVLEAHPMGLPASHRALGLEVALDATTILQVPLSVLLATLLLEELEEAGYV
jgi:hypothetical protein